MRYGAFVLELKSHLTEVMQGGSKLRYVHNVRTALTARPPAYSTLTPLLSLDRSRRVHGSPPWSAAG